MSVALSQPLPLAYAGGREGGQINPWFIAVTVTIATFMELLDTSIANVALPHIAGGLGVSTEESTWVLSSYLVANAVVLPLSAWLSRVFGRKNYYMACVALFTGSSFLCGVAPSLGWLIFFRVLQGIGGGGLAPCEQAILVDTFPASKRASAFAVYSFAIVAAPAIGPTLGGWLTDSYSWRWVFLINIPFGVMSLLLTSRLVHDLPEFTAERRALRARGGLKVDYLGILFIALGLGCMEVVLDKGQEEDWFNSHFIAAFAAVAAVSIVAAVVWELTRKDPVVDFTLLKDRNFAIASVFYFLFGFVLFGSTVLVPQLLQNLLGYTATDAGMVLTPGAMVIMAMIPLIVRLLKRVGPKPLLITGFSVLAYSLWRMTHFDLTMDYGTALHARLIQGFGLAFLFIPTSQVAYSYLPKNKNNKASSLTNLFRNLGGSFGIAAVTTLVSRRAQVHQTYLGAHVTAYDASYRDWLAGMAHALSGASMTAVDAANQAQARLYHMVVDQASMLGYLDTFLVLAVVALVGVPLALGIRNFRPGGEAPAH